jgi:putative transposase
MTRKTFKYKLYRTDKFFKLDRQLNVACHIYNHILALHKRWYRLFGSHKTTKGKYLSKARIQAHIAKLRNHKYLHWKNLNSQTVQQIAERIDFGYKKFFKKDNKRPPSFRKRKKYKSITLKTSAWKLEGNCLRLYGKWNFRFWKSRDIEGDIKTITLKKDSVGDWWVCFSCDNVPSTKKETTTGKIEGFDFGLKTFLTPSQGEAKQSPLYLKRSLRKLKTASRSFSRRVKGSNGQEKAKLRLAKVHRHVAFQRLDYHFKLANELCKKFQYLIFEDLNLKGMKRLWGRKVSDLGFSQFMTILEHKAKEFVCKLIKIEKFFPSSKRCSSCQEIKKELSLRERTFSCEFCGLKIDRDLNAAINIKAEGLRILLESLLSLEGASSINAMIDVRLA